MNEKMNASKTSTAPAGAESMPQPTAKKRLGVSDQEFREMGRIGALYYDQGNLEKARTIFEGLVTMDPGSSAAHAALGALLTRTQEDDRALEHLNLAIKLDDKEISSYVNRAEVLLRQKQGEAAVADLKRAIALDPQQKDPAANRARAMVVGIHDALQVESMM